MATKVLDRDKVVELLKQYRPSLTIEKAGGGTQVLSLLCPFHTESNPSFIFNPATDRGLCFACKKSASLSEIISKFEGISTQNALKKVLTCYRNVTKQEAERKVHAVDTSMAQLITWNQALSSDITLQTLIKRWGWTPEITLNLMLGSSEGRLVIPILEDETIVGLKFYSPGAAKLKYQNMTGTTATCWPLANLAKDKVYLVEGEKDCITMIAAGFNAVTFTSGAGTVPMAYIKFFAGKEVYIIYDVDEAGRKGAVTVAQALSFSARMIKIVDLPLGGIPKGDVTDMYLTDPENFAGIIKTLTENSEEYVAPAVVSRVTVPPLVYKTYLEDIVKSKLFYRRVNMKVRVVNNAQHETTIVPKDVHVTCNKDFKDAVCSACPMQYSQVGINLHIRPEYPELMSMVGNNNKVQREAIRSMANIAESCPKFKIEQKTHQALYPIVIIPAIEADKKTHNYSMTLAWALDVPSEENDDYDVEGVVLASPETQKMELVCYRMSKDVASIDSFELTPMMAESLRVFQCAALASNQLTTS